MTDNRLLSVLFLSFLACGAWCQTVTRWCVPQVLASYCQEMANDLPELYECVVARDMLECAEKLSEGKADISNMDPRALYVAGKNYGVVPIASELLLGEPHRYEGIALVRKDSDITTPEQLLGRSSCHTGVGRTVGWFVPLGMLLAKGIMKPNCTYGLLASTEQFFRSSCAPGDWSADPVVDRELKKRHPGLCSLCQDPKSCSSSDSYAGYQGAMRCLLDARGDVAFTKVPAFQELLEAYPTVADWVEILCLEGGRQAVEEDGTLPSDLCTWGRRPTNAFVTGARTSEERRESLLALLQETIERYPTQEQAPEWLHEMFYSDSKATGMLPLDSEHSTYTSYLGDFIHAIEIPRPGCESARSAVVCAASEPERAKCLDWKKAAEGRGFDTSVDCILAASRVACMEILKQRHADLLTLNGGDVYKGGKYYDLAPLAAEIYGDSDASYYAVAVIRSVSDISKLSDLRGLKSCHTRMGWYTGWLVPVGSLLEDGELPDDQCNRAEAVADFFDGSCVPGANDTKYNPDRTRSADLCRQCIGDINGEHKCAPDNQDRYSGYAGALRCLAEGRGDVAFTKHTTVPQYTDGKSTESWTKDLLSSDFKLLCAKGGTAAITEYEKCNLASVPSHYVMTGGSTTQDERLKLARVLADSAKYFGDDSILFKLFAKYKPDQADLLFKDSATDLQVSPLSSRYSDVLGETFLKALEAIDPNACVSRQNQL